MIWAIMYRTRYAMNPPVIREARPVYSSLALRREDAKYIMDMRNTLGSIITSANASRGSCVYQPNTPMKPVRYAVMVTMALFKAFVASWFVENIVFGE